MSKIRKIYKYINKLIRTCYACSGHGKIKIGNSYMVCTFCEGDGGYYKRVKVLVGEEEIS